MKRIGDRLKNDSAAQIAVSEIGRIAFTGLAVNRRLDLLTQQEIRNAIGKIGMRESHNAHFVSRLIERGPSFGISTLGDLATAINDASARVGRRQNTIELTLTSGKAVVVVNLKSELVTLRPQKRPPEIPRKS